MNINRYRQGFYKFGPMEQCNDGDWVKYDDFEEKIYNMRNIVVLDIMERAEMHLFKNVTIIALILINGFLLSKLIW